jgi:hypothetical protein
MTTIIRLLGPHGVQDFIDVTRDRFGSGQWQEPVSSDLTRVDQDDLAFVAENSAPVRRG